MPIASAKHTGIVVRCECSKGGVPTNTTQARARTECNTGEGVGEHGTAITRVAVDGVVRLQER